MFIKIRVRSKPPQPSGVYPIRVTSLAASTAIHCVAIFTLLSASPRGAVSRRPIMDELIQPKIHKIIIYDFRKKIPDVEPLKKSGQSPDPRGAEQAQQAMVVTSRKPKSTQQMIWFPARKLEIHQDVPLPNLIARMKTSLPVLPALPKEKPRPEVTGIEEISTEIVKPPKPVRVYVPPPASVREPKLVLPTQVTEAPPAPPAMQAPGLPSMPAGAPLPTLNMPVAPVPSPGDAKADIAIASLHPAEEVKNAMPDGGRAGRFSKAPETGKPASGDVGKPGVVVVPNLTVRENKPVKVLPDPNRTRAVLYAERVRSIPVSTLSVPLRPSSRTIPRAVDARFQGRNVYTMVIPIENIPAYSGDWIVWFAEQQPTPGSNPLVRAPLPFRKIEPVNETASGNSGEARVQISAILEADGRLSKIAVLTKPGPMTGPAVIQDLESWEFKPATRDGVPVAVEVVIEIPFNLSNAAKQVQP